MIRFKGIRNGQVSIHCSSKSNHLGLDVLVLGLSDQVPGTIEHYSKKKKNNRRLWGVVAILNCDGDL